MLLVRLQHRKEPRPLGRREQRRLSEHDTAGQSPSPSPETPFVVPQTLQDYRCPFCICDTSLPMKQRNRKWKNNNTFWEHVEKNVHHDELKGYASGKKRCGICRERGVHLQGMMAFKAHTFWEYGRELRKEQL
ncbi:hypothetical protein BDDG_12360 [Blastomyces dermatitidis ATCC 18188]|uniref:Uncharacterized protein n=1 Tax=Ajellomyces dermatitidis (strain ATCC 18188 / CBS 674.68) TaxID=653446 RepID=A0A0J9HFI3_AJEDA|nr:hypothetical protein BDFG_06876 [Blastomyces dermatitidis ATCC 26199]KMW67829.1 hypothetical protein BDDG_12360 [Blastomyces dermatitidis ATCC 18188]